ncbi:IS66 family insertion sequence hypothetical protein, partial [Candidatus Erwinia dacicola]|nr:IS66 family insertion sequence hypothetical protein [Candidatus Erwinia dacicola]
MRKEPHKNYSNDFKLRSMVELVSRPGACVA